MSGCRPQVLPPLLDAATAAKCAVTFGALDTASAATIIKQIESQFYDTWDNLIATQVDQAASANKQCGQEHSKITKGSMVMLSTYHCCHEYVSGDEDRVAKFFSHFDSPYGIVTAHPE
ncbi:unnamed protein product [Peniophora sp. CBMAI 1063]|nr:unnamed protein product [Peniophora sp. CBMAI 1063]